MQFSQITCHVKPRKYCRASLLLSHILRSLASVFLCPLWPLHRMLDQMQQEYGPLTRSRRKTFSSFCMLASFPGFVSLANFECPNHPPCVQRSMRVSIASCTMLRAGCRAASVDGWGCGVACAIRTALTSSQQPPPRLNNRTGPGPASDRSERVAPGGGGFSLGDYGSPASTPGAEGTT
jgi:hypothetical protein